MRESTEKQLHFLLVIILFSFSVVSLILSITAFTSLSENTTVIVNTINNWKSNTILDISVGNDGECPTDFEPAYSFKWPGTHYGCDCRGAFKPSYRLQGFYLGVCNSSELLWGCDQSPQFNSRNMYNWDSISSAPKTICLKRTTENFAARGPSQGFQCAADQNTCGTSIDNIFCTNEGTCPITSVEIVSSACVDCVQIGDSKYIKWTRGEDILPLAEFRINEYGMCNEANDKSQTPGRDYYRMLVSNGWECNGEGNKFWKEIDTQTEEDLYSLNDIDVLVTELEDFDYYQSGKSGADYDYHLYVRNYVPFKFQCRAQMDDVVNKSSNIDSIRSAHLGLLIITCISFFFVGLVIPGMEIYNLMGKDIDCIPGIGRDEARLLMKCKGITYYFFKLIMFPFQIWALVEISKVKDLVSLVAENDCSSRQMNVFFDKASQTLAQSWRNDITSVVLLILMTSASIFIVLRKSKLCKSYGNEDKPRINNNDDSTINSSHRDLLNQSNVSKGNGKGKKSNKVTPIGKTKLTPGQNQNQTGIQSGFQQPSYQQQPLYQQQQPMMQHQNFTPGMYQPEQPPPQQIVIQINTGPQNQQPQAFPETVPQQEL